MNKALIGLVGPLALATCALAASPLPLNERRARPSPDWVTGGVVYQVQPRAFSAVNLANPELREYLWKNMEYWGTDFDADEFRCDVSNGVPLDSWETARDRLTKIRPDICMLAEGERRENQLKAFDLSYSFTWFNTVRRFFDKGEPVSSIHETWETMASQRPRGARFIRYIDNHDIANDAFNSRIEKAWGPQRVNATLVALFTLDGVPLLYNGQEVADTARHSIFGRSPIDWANGNMPTGKARQAFCRKLCAMRHAERALTHGAVVWLDNDQPDSVLSFLRRTSSEEILSVLNLSDLATKVRITLPEPTQWPYNRLIADSAEVAGDGSGPALNLEGFGYLVAKRK